MRELSLNILDIAQNGIAAQATLISVEIGVDTVRDLLTIRIADNGKGMDAETLKRVSDPFFTTRKTRDVGLGLPFHRMQAECAGGAFSIESAVGEGTTVTTSYQISHIDRLPLGDVADTFTALCGTGGEIDFVLTYRADGREFAFDTREARAALDEIPLNTPEVLLWIKENVSEGIRGIFDKQI